MKTPIQVKILGRKYTLRVKPENEERTRTVAKGVDRRMRAFQRQHPEQAKLTTAIITALALAEDLRLERETHRRNGEALDGDLRALTRTLVEALEAEPPAPGAKASGDGESA